MWEIKEKKNKTKQILFPIANCKNASLRFSY